MGSIQVGERLPAALLGDDLASHYLACYIADAIPVDAFVYEVPPLLVILDSGPFRALFSHTGSSARRATETLGGKAAAAARQNAKVRTIMVRGAGPATEAGVGVGSRLAELRAAYADLRWRPTPETLGDDVCVSNTASLPGVWFVFETCDKARNGAPVTRVDISRTPE